MLTESTRLVSSACTHLRIEKDMKETGREKESQWKGNEWRRRGGEERRKQGERGRGGEEEEEGPYVEHEVDFFVDPSLQLTCSILSRALADPHSQLQGDCVNNFTVTCNMLKGVEKAPAFVTKYGGPSNCSNSATDDTASSSLLLPSLPSASLPLSLPVLLCFTLPCIPGCCDISAG